MRRQTRFERVVNWLVSGGENTEEQQQFPYVIVFDKEEKLKKLKEEELERLKNLVLTASKATSGTFLEGLAKYLTFEELFIISYSDDDLRGLMHEWFIWKRFCERHLDRNVFRETEATIINDYLHGDHEKLNYLWLYLIASKKSIYFKKREQEWRVAEYPFSPAIFIMETDLPPSKIVIYSSWEPIKILSKVFGRFQIRFVSGHERREDEGLLAFGMRRATFDQTTSIEFFDHIGLDLTFWYDHDRTIYEEELHDIKQIRIVAAYASFAVVDTEIFWQGDSNEPAYRIKDQIPF